MPACDICKRMFSDSDLIPASAVRRELAALIEKEHPGWKPGKRICTDDLNKYRALYVSKLISREKGTIAHLERAVIKSIHESELLSNDVNREYSAQLTVGQRVADGIAKFGGSWRFILIFLFCIAGWIALNTIQLFIRPFDPFPFILLNLILSCIAAIQAPVIMMSQNRQESKDRLRADNDYKINLKAEIEIKTLHEKIDHFLLDQWGTMMKIQQIQMEMIEEIRQKLNPQDH